MRVTEFIEKDTAAVLHYKLDNKVGEHKYFLFHMGGHTLETTMFSLMNGTIQINKTSSDSIGGNDFDKRLEGHFMVQL